MPILDVTTPPAQKHTPLKAKGALFRDDPPKESFCGREYNPRASDAPIRQILKIMTYIVDAALASAPI